MHARRFGLAPLVPRELPYVTSKKQRRVEASLAEAENERQGPAIMDRVLKPAKSKAAQQMKQQSKTVILPKHLDFQAGQLRSGIVTTKQTSHLTQNTSRAAKDTALVQ